VFKNLSIGVLALLLAACGAPKVRHAVPPPKPEESISRPGLPPGRVYRIDENQSELRILVYRAGPLARFGHNHVMVNHAIRGAVNLADVPGDSVFWLTVPVAGFVVDDAQARREEGGDFAGDIPDDAKSGTLHNMLTAALLNADEFPEIAVRSVAESGARAASGAGALTATVAISVAGHESTVDVPLTLQVDSRRLSAAGSMELRQSALGLTPFSLMLGALQVQDAMTIKFDIVAVPD
jgi:YceI-like domain